MAHPLHLKLWRPLQLPKPGNGDVESSAWLQYALFVATALNLQVEESQGHHLDLDAKVIGTLPLNACRFEDKHALHLRYPAHQASPRRLLWPWQMEGQDRSARQTPKTALLASLATMVCFPLQGALVCHAQHPDMLPGFQTQDLHLHPTMLGLHECLQTCCHWPQVCHGASLHQSPPKMHRMLILLSSLDWLLHWLQHKYSLATIPSAFLTKGETAICTEMQHPSRGAWKFTSDMVGSKPSWACVCSETLWAKRSESHRITLNPSSGPRSKESCRCMLLLHRFKYLQSWLTNWEGLN